MASFDSVPTLKRSLKRATSASFFSSFFVFFAAGGPEEESVLSAEVEPVKVDSLLLSSAVLARFRRLAIVECEGE